MIVLNTTGKSNATDRTVTLSDTPRIYILSLKRSIRTEGVAGGRFSASQEDEKRES